MIFSRLFTKKNKWQAKDSNVRIAAINEELSITNADDKKVLLALLNTDSSELVRRAALLKLNDFDIYLLASHENDNASVKQFAFDQVISILTNEHNIRLSTQQKQDLIQQPSCDVFLTPWLQKESDPQVVTAIFSHQNLQSAQPNQKKNIGHLFAQLFTHKQEQAVQSQLLALPITELSDISFLTKLQKKSASKAVSAMLAEKIEQLLIAEEKPKKLQKQLQLVLSKLLALKDINDYGLYQDKRSELEKEWQQGQESFTCLAEEQQAQLTQKYQKIGAQLMQLFAPKAEAYQQERIAEQLFIDKQETKKHFDLVIADINQVITTAVFEDNSLDEVVFSKQLASLQQEVESSVLNETEQAKYVSQLSELAKRLTQLPEIAQSVSEATHLISKISQLAIPQNIEELNERQSIYNDWLINWKAVERKASGVLPTSIKDAHKEITGHWGQGLKPLVAEQKKLFSQTRKKLADIKRLLTNGKFKVCFGLFKGVKKDLTLLSEQQQHQLQRDFEQVSEKMSELSDWEHYIATPRKQQLLEEITALVQTPLDNPNDQADKVKQYRKIWNSLGHADEDVDKALNEQFNQACEQAFAPCRLFYAEQEKLRGQNLLERKAIISQATQIAQAFTESQAVEKTALELAANFKQLDGQLNKLQQAWSQVGEVDRKEYQKLQHTFKQTLHPVKTAIKAFHENNSHKKQELILQAKQQLTVEDVFKAIEEVKQLQQQWRDVGFAGSRQENKLWQEFRQVNDEIFARRTQIKTEQHEAQAELAAQFNQSLADIKEKLGNVADKVVLNQAKQDAEALLTSVIANKPVIKSVAHTIETFIKTLQEQLTKQKEQEQRESWQSLFALLKELAQAELADITNNKHFSQVNNFWQKRLQEQVSIKGDANLEARQTKVLAIEILAQAESPAKYAQQRMAVQVELMQEQMLSGGDIDLTSQLVDWLQLGKLSQQDTDMLERLEKIFVR
ncbi:MAG: DUF349 domain-containing protein [Colwellia sp.]|nr:DUF349 domain-containing protein [Colwellia sp.]MCW9081599.1 DUF349 domain-containing protein [Colwellia sp.]